MVWEWDQQFCLLTPLWFIANRTSLIPRHPPSVLLFENRDLFCNGSNRNWGEACKQDSNRTTFIEKGTAEFWLLKFLITQVLITQVFDWSPDRMVQPHSQSPFQSTCVQTEMVVETKTSALLNFIVQKSNYHHFRQIQEDTIARVALYLIDYKMSICSALRLCTGDRCS